MTQLIIAGVEAVLPQNFSVTVKRENPFFTKSGQYTYDCTLRIDNPVNQQLYGFLHRVNRSGQIETDRTAILMADGHVYCRGTEVITRWTDQTVTIQILSGESELNFFIGQDKKIEDLDLGSIEGTVTTISGSATWPQVDYCLPTLRGENGGECNVYNRSGSIISGGQRTGQSSGFTGTNIRPMPFLCAILDRLIKALGYNEDREMVNQLKDTQFKYLFLVNTVYTTEFAKMIPGWTVKEFLTEVEKLTGCVFVTDNIHKHCDILLKSVYYQDARQLPLSDVVDAYEAEVQDDEGRESEFTSSDVSYELPDHHWTNIMKLPEGFLESADIKDYGSIADIVAATGLTGREVLHDTSTDRYYIQVSREWTATHTDNSGVDKYLVEIDQFRNLDRENNTSTLELKITPAPMACLGRHGCEVIDLGSTDGYKNQEVSDSETEEDDTNADIEQSIRDFQKDETQAGDLYCAFHNGTARERCPIVYTDGYHASIQVLLYPMFGLSGEFTGTPVGSLRLSDLDADYYQGGYEIDTRHAMTFETFDPNTIDVRQVYVIRNRRFVVRDVEETITAEGRKPLWRVTCFPIKVSDEAIEKRWVLTHGVWDDGAAWLDDGRWNDTDPNSQ